MDNARFASGPEDFPSREEVVSVSGLEYMRRMIAGEVPHPTVARLMNYRIVLAEPGRIEMRAFPAHEQSNAFGSVQGGWYGMVLDSCMSMAVISGLKPGQFQATIEYKINLIRAIRPGTELCVSGILEHIGRSTGVARGEIRGTQDGKLYAMGSTTCAILGEARAD